MLEIYVSLNFAYRYAYENVMRLILLLRLSTAISMRIVQASNKGQQLCSLLHRPLKRKEGLLLTACACTDIFPHKFPECVRENILKVIHRAI